MDAESKGKQATPGPETGTAPPATGGKVPPKLKVPKPAAKPAARKPAVSMTDTTRAVKPPPAPVPPTRRAPPTEMVTPLRKTETTRIDLAEALTEDQLKSKTSPIEAVPPAAEKAATTPIGIAEAGVDMKAITAPLDLSGVGVDTKATTAPIELSGMDVDIKATTARIDKPAGAEPEAKRATARIDLPEAGAKPPPIPVARGITEGPIEDLEEIMKKSTVRIDSALPESAALSPEDVVEATKKATVRVQIDDEKKGDTERVDAEAILQADREETAKRKTSRIDLGEVLEGQEEQDIFKRRTAVLDSSKLPTGAPPAPRTIRIKRPGAPAPTAVLPSETAHIAVPAAMPVAEPPDARKAETARIELPPEAAMERPTARRKTIRIKRPDGTITSRQVTIARAGEAGEEAAVEEGAPVEEETGAVFAVLALAAVLMSLGLVVVNFLATRSLSGF